MSDLPALREAVATSLRAWAVRWGILKCTRQIAYHRKRIERYQQIETLLRASRRDRSLLVTTDERAAQLRDAGGDPLEPYWAEARIEELKEAVERAYREGWCRADWPSHSPPDVDDLKRADAAWLASEAKARLT